MEKETTFTETLDVARKQGKVQEDPIEFDLDRLAEDIDGVFNKVLENHIENLDTLQNNKFEEFSESIEEQMQIYGESIEAIFPEIKQRLLDEIAKGRTIIVLPDATEINVLHSDHPKMESVIKSLHLHKKAMLVGPAGTGKTTMIGHIAERKKLPFYKYSCSRDSSVHDLLGYKQPASETYLETSFLNAYENGGIFLVDEYDAMSGDMALFFNGVADNSKFISIPHRDTKPTAEKHKDFYLIMCGNTWGKGSTDYSGRDFQDMALMDRFRFCRHFIGYHFELERNLMKHNYPFAQKLREALEDIGSYLSTRNVEDISNLIPQRIPKHEIVEMVCQDFDEDDRNTVINAVANASITIDNILVRDGNGVELSLSKLKTNFPVSDHAKMAVLRNQDVTLFNNYLQALKTEKE